MDDVARARVSNTSQQNDATIANAVDTANVAVASDVCHRHRGCCHRGCRSFDGGRGRFRFYSDFMCTL
jgi:hypothetical protein